MTDYDKILKILVICLPVFALVGLGKILHLKGVMTDDRRVFVNRIVYFLALPALIFNEVARQRFDAFLDPALTVIPLLAIIAVAAVMIVLGRLLGYKGYFAAAFVFGSFWANCTYMGFPLCKNAFGPEGLAKAAVYNGFVMPVFVAGSFLIIGLYSGGSSVSVFSRIKKAVLNPVVLAAVSGLIVAAAAELLRDANGVMDLPLAAGACLDLVASFLKLTGSMGLPLALLAIGASLKWSSVAGNKAALTLVVLMKMAGLPLLTLLLIRSMAPGTDPEALGVAVLLSATPSAVASYVVSCEIGVEPGFVASLLVLTTAAGIISIPAWLYFGLL